MKQRPIYLYKMKLKIYLQLREILTKTALLLDTSKFKNFNKLNISK